ncbi:hypothetical protein SEUCBS139899_010651 [Sporothrix eucalyptigena]
MVLLRRSSRLAAAVPEGSRVTKLGDKHDASGIDDQVSGASGTPVMTAAVTVVLPSTEDSLIEAIPGPSDLSTDSSLNSLVATTSDRALSVKAVTKAPASHRLAALQAERRASRLSSFDEHCVTLDKEVAWFDDDSVVEVIVTPKGDFANFSLAADPQFEDSTTPPKSRSAKHGAPRRAFNNNWATFLCSVAVYEIEGPYKDLYFCWVLRTTAKQDALWRGLHSDNALLQYWTNNHHRLAPRANPVYVERINGGPIGAYAGAICADGRRLKGLFIQIYGLRNAVPCESCERMYRRYVNPGPAEKGVGQRPRHVMAPFFDCISLPGYNKGVCGNCTYSIANTMCSYHPQTKMDSVPDWVASKMASDLTEARLPPRRLSLTASPITGPDLAAPILKQRATNAKGRGWMADQAAFGRAIDWEGTAPSASAGALDQTPGTFNSTPVKPSSGKGATKDKGKGPAVRSFANALADDTPLPTPSKVPGCWLEASLKLGSDTDIPDAPQVGSAMPEIVLQSEVPLDPSTDKDSGVSQ